jgi:hypothetical protein
MCVLLSLEFTRRFQRNVPANNLRAPPKVIWLRIGSTAGIEAFIRTALVKIPTFEVSAEDSLLVLS